MTTTITLPGRISGQNILNALKYAASAPKGEKFKWRQQGKRTSGTFELLECRPTALFRRKGPAPKYIWNVVPGISMEVLQDSLPLDPNQTYEGKVLLNLCISSKPHVITNAAAAAYLKILGNLPKQLEDRVITTRSFSADEADRMSA